MVYELRLAMSAWMTMLSIVGMVVFSAVISTRVTWTLT